MQQLTRLENIHSPIPQGMTAWDVLEHVITHVPMFFAQRQPRELGTFTWIVDGKEPAKVTDWERWWRNMRLVRWRHAQLGIPDRSSRKQTIPFLTTLAGIVTAKKAQTYILLFADFRSRPRQSRGLNCRYFGQLRSVAR